MEFVDAPLGDVVGPASAINDNIVTFNTTTGKLIKDSAIPITSLFNKVVDNADDIVDATALNKFTNATDIARLANTSGTNTGDQDLSGYLRKDIADTKTIGDLTFNNGVKASFGTLGAGMDIYSLNSFVQLNVINLIDGQLTIQDNGVDRVAFDRTSGLIISNGGFKKGSGTNTNVLLDGGGVKLVSDFALQTDINEWSNSSGTRVGGDLVIAIGDYDGSSNGAIIAINDSANTIDMLAGAIQLIGTVTLTQGVGVSAIRDEDDMVSNDSSALATQQSIKAYVDTNITGTNSGVNTGDQDLSGYLLNTTDVFTGNLDINSGNLSLQLTKAITFDSDGDSFTYIKADDTGEFGLGIDGMQYGSNTAEHYFREGETGQMGNIYSARYIGTEEVNLTNNLLKQIKAVNVGATKGSSLDTNGDIYAWDGSQVISLLPNFGILTAPTMIVDNSSGGSTQLLFGESVNTNLISFQDTGGAETVAYQSEFSNYLLNTTDTFTGNLTVTGDVIIGANTYIKANKKLTLDTDVDGFSWIMHDNTNAYGYGADILIYGSVNGHHFINGEDSAYEPIKAGSFVKDGGTSSQFLKANGSVDSSTYLTTTGDGSSLTNVDAELLDGIDSSQFVRTDTSSTISAGGLTLDTYVRLNLGDNASGGYILYDNNGIDFRLLDGDLKIQDSTTDRFTFGRTTGDFTATGYLEGLSLRLTNGGVNNPTSNIIQLGDIFDLDITADIVGFGGSAKISVGDGEIITTGVIYPAITNVDQIGTSSKRYSTVFATNGDFSGNVKAKGYTFDAQVGTSVTAGDALYLKTDGKWWLADATTEATSSTEIAIATVSGSADATIAVLGNGVMAGFTGLTVGVRYYLDETAGTITDDRSGFSDNSVSRYVGTAKSATELYFKPDSTYIILTI